VSIAALAKFGLSGSSTPAHGRLAPALPKQRLLGANVTLANLLAGAHGRPVLVVFWASWCGPCHVEAPALERFSRSAGGRGRLVGVDWSDALSGAEAFIRRYRWTFPNVRDDEGLVGNSYRLPGLPATFVIDGSGHITKTLIGPQTEQTLGLAVAAL
jgi:cytochrome c biogenesis protein CcmG/thiol:disulfide interchange protein DsbE